LADNDALQKIIDNLLQNALNYCSQYVLVKLENSTDRPNHIAIKFINDGLAISPSFKEKIFQPFFRLESSKNKSGTGIGLALAQSLTHLQNGTLELKESNDSQTIFVLQLPTVFKN
jgi:signal transduction histidine kinase